MNIPEELKTKRRFVCFDKQKRPINAMTGTFASSTDSDTWSSYDEAIAGIGKFKLKGIGDGYCGIDIDTCISPDTGYISDEAKEIDSYTEVSISGYGLHILIKENGIVLPFNKKDMQVNSIIRPDIDLATGKQRLDKDGKSKFKAPELEIYNNGRYFTLSGNIFSEKSQ